MFFRNYCIGILIMIGLSAPSMGQMTVFQQINDQQEIIFDSAGRMATFPKIFVQPHTRMSYRVMVPETFLQQQLQKMGEKIRAASENLESSENTAALNCLFKDNDKFTLIKKKLQDIGNLLAETKWCDKKQVDSLKKIASDIADYIPVNFFLNNMKRQYALRIFRGNTCVKEIDLDLQENECGKPCYYFSSNQWKRFINYACNNCSSSDQNHIRFQLVHRDPWTQTLRDWYIEKSKELEEKFKNEPSERNNLETALMQAATTADNEIFETNVAGLTTLTRQMMYWLWFTEGGLIIDPLRYLKEEAEKEIETEIKSTDRNITHLQQQLVFLDSARLKVDEKKRLLPLYEKIQLKWLQVNTELTDAIDKKKRLEKSLAPNTFLTSFRERKILYNGEFRLSTATLAFFPTDINPHKQFDAADNYLPIRSNIWQRRKLTEIPENEQLHVLVHNIPDTQGVRMDEKKLPFDDKEEFTLLVSKQLSQINFSGLPVAIAQQAEDFLGSLVTKLPASTVFAGLQNEEPDVSCLKRLQGVIKEFYASWQRYELPVPMKVLAKTAESAPAFSDRLMPSVIQTDEAYLDSITIKRFAIKDSSKVTDVAKTFVKVGKLRYLKLAAGIAFNKNPVETSTIDTANGFRRNTDDNRAHLIFGFQFYPFKNYNRDGYLVPRYFFRRFSAFGGLDVIKPLNNFYLGGAYDIVPGLAFSTGWNYYLKTYYQIENNTIVSSARRYKKSGAYYAVVVNPLLMVEFVKTFFK